MAGQEPTAGASRGHQAFVASDELSAIGPVGSTLSASGASVPAMASTGPGPDSPQPTSAEAAVPAAASPVPASPEATAVDPAPRGPAGPAQEAPDDARADVAERSAPDESQRTGLPFSAVLGLIAGLALFATSLTPLRDIDVFWHVLAGQQMLDGVALDQVGSTWSFAVDPRPWTSTQWLSEVAFAGLYNAFGWAGLAAFRVLSAAVAVAILAVTTLRGRPRAIAGFPFLLAAVMLAFVSQDRPAQFTLIGAAALGGVLVTGLTTHRLPRWWLLLPATVLWSNLHGGWVLVPGILILIAVGVALDDGIRVPVVRRALLLTGGTVVAGCLTPSGIGELTAPLRFSEAAVLIKEWAPVEPTSALGGITLVMLALFLIGWSAGGRLPRSEAFAVLALFCFTWLANRNLAPGLAMMAPLAAHCLCRAFPRAVRPEPRWSTPVGVTLAAVLTLAGLVSVGSGSNLPSAMQPLQLARMIATLPPGQRVLNDYNTSGAVLFFGGPDTKVAIDGRSDRYGAEYIQRYVELTALRGNWQALLDQLQPTAALLEADAPLTRLLVHERNWRQVGPVEAGHVLLVPPGTASDAAQDEPDDAASPEPAPPGKAASQSARQGAPGGSLAVIARAAGRGSSARNTHVGVGRDEHGHQGAGVGPGKVKDKGAHAVTDARGSGESGTDGSASTGVSASDGDDDLPAPGRGTRRHDVPVHPQPGGGQGAGHDVKNGAVGNGVERGHRDRDDLPVGSDGRPPGPGAGNEGDAENREGAGQGKASEAPARGRAAAAGHEASA